MQEGVYETAMGSIHYWMDVVNAGEVTLVFLPGLTADHRLFDKQIEFSATASTYSSGMCRVMRHRGRSIFMSGYGRALMRDMMLVYDGDQRRYAKIAGHGYRILADAVEADLPYKIDCPALLICGTKDHAGSCIRYNKAWHKNTGIPLEWIEGAGHNSNTDAPDVVNALIEVFLRERVLS